MNKPTHDGEESHPSTDDHAHHSAQHPASPNITSSPSHSGAHAHTSEDAAHKQTNDHAHHAPHDSALHTGHAEHPAPSQGHEQHAGHDGHTDHTGHELMFRNRFWVSLVLSVPVLLYSHMVQQLLGFTMPTFPGSQWIEPFFALIVFAYGGVPFLQMAVPELRQRKPGMMTLISLAITVALLYSLFALVVNPMGGFFWELVTLIDIMLLGHWIEMRSVRQASGALDELAALLPDTAERILPDGAVETVPLSALRIGDRLLIRPGAGIPADARVVEGESDVNEAMMTGESEPVKKQPGDPVIAGTINADGSLRVEVSALGEQTALAGIMRLVADAQASRSETQLLADRAAGWLFYVAIAVAILTGLVWTYATGFNLGVVERVATVLVIACPHALGLAVPLVVAITTALAARNGVLVRNRLALENARNIDTIVFDKTGTLTKGEQGVVAMTTTGGESEADALARAAAVEGDSEHMVARAMQAEASKRNLALPAVTQFEALKGRGVTAQVEGETLHVGGPRMLELLNVTLPPDLQAFTEAQGAQARSVIYLMREQRPVAAFALADVIRDESRDAIQRLQALGIEVAMLTGDSEAVAQSVARELGIDRYFAQVLPEHKERKIAELQAQGKTVAMVGDGVNDAPALTRADIGIAIGGGTDVAIESADIVLVKSNPLDVVNIIELSRASYRKMVENLLWASGYNIIALPLAAGVLAPLGILLSPAVGAVLMSLSTIIVALNAQLLRRVQLS